MPVKLSIDITSIGIESAPGDAVVLSSPVIRESLSRPGGLVSTAPFVAELTDGKTTVEVEPGPVVVSFRCRNIRDSTSKEVNIPQEDCSLADVLADHFTYSPSVESRITKAITDFWSGLAGVNELVTSAASSAQKVIGSEANVEKLASEVDSDAQSAQEAGAAANEAMETAQSAAKTAVEKAAAAGISQEEAAKSAKEALDAESRIGQADKDATAAAELATEKATESSNSAAAADKSAQDARAAADDATSGVADATSTVKGKIRLGGDLGGTADEPRVIGLTQKADLVGGLVPTSQLPAVALTKPQVVGDRAGMLGLTAQEGDIAVITSGTDKGTYMLGSGSPSDFSSWVFLAAPSDAVSSVNGQTGVVNLAASDVGAAPTSHTHTSSQISDATSAATANTVITRDSAGRAQVANPSAAADIATKDYVDTGLSKKAATSHTHTSAQITDIHIVSALPASPTAGHVYIVTG